MDDPLAEAAFEAWWASKDTENLLASSVYVFAKHAFLAARSARAPQQEVGDDDNDDIDEALSDAVSDGEGRLYVRYVRQHLASRGLAIVRVRP